MSDLFSFTRLWLLIRRQAVENYKFYLLCIALMAGLLILFYSIGVRSLGYDSDTQQIFFFFSLALSGSVFTNVLLKELHGATTAIWYLTFPVSTVEKLVLVLFYSILVFIPVHLVLFYAIDTAFVNYYNTYYSPETKHTAAVLDLFVEDHFTFIYYSFLLIQAAVLLGSIWFNRFSYVKTIVTIFLVGVVVIFIDDFIADTLFHQDVQKILFNRFYIKNDEQLDSVTGSLPGQVQHWYAALKYLLIPFLWATAWVRLKETQL